jgi:phage terminase large subunit
MREIQINDAYYPYLENQSRTQIYYGGSGSGKSVFKARMAVYDLARGGRNYLICRQVGRTIRRSVFNEINRAIADAGLGDFFTVNKTEAIITAKNGYQILFAGLDDVEKMKSITPQKGSITDIWIEEATETQRATVKELLKRQRGGDTRTNKRLHLTFNPILRSHWIYEDYFAPIGWADEQTEYNSPELSILKTWYIHNLYLTRQDIDDLLNEKDEYYRNVYTFGNWGVLGNVIFRNWRVEDLSGMANQFTHQKTGLDFGFSSDPAAMPVTHYDKKNKTIYVYNELYERGMTNDVLATAMKSIIGNGYVRCDSSEPKSIAELQMHGVSAYPASKGKDSVIHGIQWLQQQTIVVDKSCINMQNELQQYKWKEDKNGNAMMQPVDKNNHLIDALRYAYEDEMQDNWYMI